MLKLVLATKSNAELIVSLIRASFKKQAEILKIEESDYPNYVAFDTEDALRRRMDNGDQVVVAHLDDISIGTVSFSLSSGEPKKGEIKRLAVLPKYRGNGYGQILMEYAEDKLSEQGTRVIEISIVAQFESLRLYYESMGYRVSESKMFPSLPFEVLFMERGMKLG